MTRGRRPYVALREAYEIAQKRGQVMEIYSNRSDHFHFILFTGDRVTFVKIKRTLAKTSDSCSVLHEYQREIRHLTRIPLTPVTSREFWVRSPGGSWQFFCLEKEKMTELRSDGAVIPGSDLPLGIPEPVVLPAIPAGDTIRHESMSKE